MTQFWESTLNEIKAKMTKSILVVALTSNHGGSLIQTKCGCIHEKTILLHASKVNTKGI